MVANSDNFTKIFMEQYLASGLGSLSKKDTEALVAFLILSQNKDEIDFYTTAIKLRITENRLRELYAHARLRFNFFNEESLLFELKKIFTKKGFKVYYVDTTTQKIEFILQDSLLKMALEHQLSLIGSYSDTSFNKSIVKIKTEDFIEVFINMTNEAHLKDLVLPKNENSAKEFAKKILLEYFSGLANEGGRATIRVLESTISPISGIEYIKSLFK